MDFFIFAPRIQILWHDNLFIKYIVKCPILSYNMKKQKGFVMRKYIRLALGANAIYAEICRKENFVGVDFDIARDLNKDNSENWREFNKKYIPVWQESHPGKSKVPAGLACGMLYTVAKDLSIGDIVICPTGSGTYYVGEISSGYIYAPGQILPHRREVKWYDGTIRREDMSEELRNSTGSIATVCNITKYSSEIEFLIGGQSQSDQICTITDAEDPKVFKLESHLEEFLVHNWENTDFGKNWDLYREDGEIVGKQYKTDAGDIDILAISKDKKTFLVIELKRGRTGDAAVGQVQRYMGYVKDILSEPGQSVKGVIIALEDDKNIRYALSVTNNIEFYKYNVSFSLSKVK